jgi:hypothetical protein
MSRNRPKYMPDVAKLLQECDLENIEAQERKALTPLLEAGLIDRLTPEPVAAASAPSPWAKDASGAGGGEIDKAALPSAIRPMEAAPAEERPVTKRAGAGEAARQPLPKSWKLVGAAAVVAVAAPVMVVAAGQWNQWKGSQGRAPEPPSTSTMPNGIAPPRATTVPSAPVAPSATVAPTASTAAASAPSGQVDGGARRPAGGGVREAPPPEDNPYDEPKRPPTKSKPPPMIF